jgi:hypothetical protein
MPVMQITIDNWKVQIRALMEGHRWCVACGTVSVPRTAPHYVVRCEGCFRDFMETQGKGKPMNVILSNAGMFPRTGSVRLSASGMAKNCRKCGNQLEHDRVEYALRHSGGKRECLSCLPCSRGWNTAVHGIFIPNYWRDYADQLFPVAAQ